MPVVIENNGLSRMSFTENDDLLSQHEEEGSVPPIVPVKSNPGIRSGERGRMRVVLAAAGVAALVACAVVVAMRPPPSQSTTTSGEVSAPQVSSLHSASDLKAPVVDLDARAPRSWSAGELFWSPEVHEVATENLMQVGKGLLVHADRDGIRTAVARAFRNVSLRLEAREHSAAAMLATLRLSEAEKGAVLTSLRLLSMPQVQSIGLDVGLAIRSSASTDPTIVEDTIEAAVRPHLAGIERLRDDLVSGTLFELWGVGKRWRMSLAPENIQVMQASHGGKLYTGSASEIPPLEEKNLVVLGGVLEEARALLDVLSLCAHREGQDLHVPAWATSMGDNIELGPGLLSCELGFAHDVKADFKDFMRALFCPLKYGSQGIDALRAVSDLMGPPRRNYRTQTGISS